jgi:hypothetical protein
VLAEADATLLKAKQLYEQAAKSSDPNQRQLALSRLQTIQLIPVSPAAAKQVGSPTTGAPVGPPSVTLSATGIPAQTTGGNAALYAAPTATGPAQWSKWGTLRRTQFNINGQATYRLEDQRGASLGYAVAAPGLTLEPYVGRLVCLYGPTAYRSDGAMRSDYTIAYQLDWRDR